MSTECANDPDGKIMTDSNLAHSYHASLARGFRVKVW